ncbi:MAG TPA: PIN domain-containing protein [Ardenticatenaceae bacterium]
MSKTIFVDTLFVVASINPRDQYHRQAAELVKRFRGHPLLITDAVLLEIGNALARNFKKEAVEIIERFLNSNQVEVVALTPELFQEALVLYKAYQDKEWGLVDCVSFVVMRRKNITSALTFDQHFVQAGFQALMR